jgi:hypothetical protein
MPCCGIAWVHGHYDVLKSDEQGVTWDRSVWPTSQRA